MEDFTTNIDKLRKIAGTFPQDEQALDRTIEDYPIEDITILTSALIPLTTYSPSIQRKVFAVLTQNLNELCDAIENSQRKN
jgi:hypothetical protein